MELLRYTALLRIVLGSYVMVLHQDSLFIVNNKQERHRDMFPDYV